MNIDMLSAKYQLQALDNLNDLVQRMDDDDAREVIKRIFEALEDLDEEDFFGTEGLDHAIGLAL